MTYTECKMTSTTPKRYSTYQELPRSRQVSETGSRLRMPRPASTRLVGRSILARDYGSSKCRLS
ncbi:hypothetical protein FOTG_19106 [Fusarium oxysporum f. sp. vasinfectum 25433]|uniref:Uncharacterized protein n=1 Tax=Fusarium oxysporum f. sp. vasinfectum 25433 TaxID=1089449 RepID=X0KFN4_FUSOX|nr:hypothetical protein FOTG_19106 [Fusarium oxysporum f. sp. vasinfectum 25433]